MAWATAKHILVDSEAKCNELKTEIENGASFDDMAKAHSSCPSSAQGGDLGKFGPGQMVPEFDKAIFSGDVGVVYGPVQTQFGYHLIEITGRG
ncbi:MAG: peptidylprolyl isomerase [Campylobacterota bacterium]|nr:peptidylprolyl isomerase [Campylobacterota bacterium]